MSPLRPMPGLNLRPIIVADGQLSPILAMRTAEGLWNLGSESQREEWEAYLWSKDADRELPDGSIA